MLDFARGHLERSVCGRKTEIKMLALLDKEVLITGGQKGVASGINAVLLQGVSQVEKKGHQVWEVKLQSADRVGNRFTAARD